MPLSATIDYNQLTDHGNRSTEIDHDPLDQTRSPFPSHVYSVQTLFTFSKHMIRQGNYDCFLLPYS